MLYQYSRVSKVLRVIKSHLRAEITETRNCSHQQKQQLWQLLRSHGNEKISKNRSICQVCSCLCEWKKERKGNYVGIIHVYYIAFAIEMVSTSGVEYSKNVWHWRNISLRVFIRSTLDYPRLKMVLNLISPQLRRRLIDVYTIVAHQYSYKFYFEEAFTWYDEVIQLFQTIYGWWGHRKFGLIYFFIFENELGHKYKWNEMRRQEEEESYII